MTESVRLQKFLASSGVASRRRSEELIANGRVEVDGVVITRQGSRLDPESTHVRVDGKRILPPAERTYVAVNKPTGIVCTLDDEHGRHDLQPLLAQYRERLFHVGRLDTDTSGLLIATNDGELAHRLAHPAFEVPKTYIAQVSGSVRASIGQQLRAGIELDDGKAAVDRFVVKERFGGRSLIELDIHIGRNRIVRRLLDAVGHPVDELTRTAFGPLRLAGLRSGQTRAIARDELGALFDSVGL